MSSTQPPIIGSLTTLEQQWTKVVDQQQETFDSATTQLEQLMATIQQLQNELAADTPSPTPTPTPTSTPIDLRSSMTRLTKTMTDTKNKLTKDFKSLFTTVTKQSARMEKLFSTDLDEFCSNQLYQSPNYIRTHANNSTDHNIPTAVATSTNSPLLPYAAITPVTNHSNGHQDSTSNAAAAPSSSTPLNDYQSWFELIMIDSWLRDGRTDLVESLRQEMNQRDGSTVQTQSNDDTHTAHEFQSMHQLVRALKRRQIEPCLQWIGEEQIKIQAQMKEIESQMILERSRIEATTTTAASSSSNNGTSGAGGARRKRVSFSQDTPNVSSSQDQPASAASASHDTSSSPMDISSSLSESSDATISSLIGPLTAQLNLLQSHSNSLATLQFDCHRLKFLQILIDSEEETRRQKRARQPRKRKHQTTPGNDPDESSQDVEMQSEEAAALAADASTSSDSDEELNQIALNGNGHAESAPAPTSFSHHSALKYAQTFFPQFASTRMDDIRKLSGCLLFLGHLTSNSPSSPAHPYASYFSLRGNQSLWCDVIRRAKSLCLQLMNKSNTNPMLVSLQACDIALPQLTKYQSVLKLNREMVAASNGSIASVPEIDLGKEFQFHSTFICPVTKEQCTTTASEEEIETAIAAAPPVASPAASHHPNLPLHHPFLMGFNANAAELLPPMPSPHSNPPVMLKCGHCISYLAMDKIVRGLRLTRSVIARAHN